MFPRQEKGLLDLAVVLLCTWAAFFHTPVGAAVRAGLSWVATGEGPARSLLAYYRGGVYGAPPNPYSRLPPAPAAPMLSEREALAQGLHVALTRLEPDKRGPVDAVLTRFEGSPAMLRDLRTGPREAERLLERMGRTFPSDEVSILALFCGEEAARYAVRRAVAEGRLVRFDDLAPQLPPGFEERLRPAREALALGTAYGLGWPLPAAVRIRSGFGMREDPFLGQERMHTGVDLPVPVGTPVVAAGAGIVRRASQDLVNGRLLVIDHGRGVSTAYLHCSRLLVDVGARVARGQVIAHAGNTGRSTGPHLHYQIELGSVPVDPLSFRPRVGAPVALPMR